MGRGIRIPAWAVVTADDWTPEILLGKDGTLLIYPTDAEAIAERERQQKKAKGGQQFSILDVSIQSG